MDGVSNHFIGAYSTSLAGDGLSCRKWAQPFSTTEKNNKEKNDQVLEHVGLF